MSYFSFELLTDNGHWSRMIYQTIMGEGHIQPKLRLTFLSRSLPKDTEVRIIQSKISLFIENEMLGKGEIVENGPTLYDSYDTQLNYES